LKISSIKNLFFKCSPLLPLLIIQACGGGSDDTTPTNNLEQTEYTFTLSSVLTNKCGVETPFTNVELLIQDSSWQITNRYTPDANGQITFITLNETINYTLVAQNQIGSNIQGLNIESFYQAITTSPVKYKGTYDQLSDQSSCECVTQNVSVSHRSFNTRSQITSSLSYSSWEAIDSDTTLFNDVEACRETNADWPLHSFSINGTDINGATIGNAVFSDNFDANIDLVWVLSAFDVAAQLDLPATHQAFETHQIVKSINHFSSSVNESDTSIMLFNSHNYIGETAYFSRAQVVFEETSSIFGSSIIESYHQISSANFDDSFSVQAETVKPEIDEVNFSEIQADGNYDYSVVANYPMAIIQFNYEVLNAQSQLINVNWTTYGPITGLLPITTTLVGYEDIITTDSDWNEIDVQLLQSASTSDYNDYVRQYQDTTLNNIDTDLGTYHIQIKK
jgi:hypothetical protein